MLPVRARAQLCVAYLVCWAVIGLGLYAFAAALHPVDLSDLPYIAASYPVAFCVAVLTFVVPSGLGTRDAALATAMAAVLAGTVATAIAVAFRIFQTVVELAYVGSGRGAGARGALGVARIAGALTGSPSAGSSSGSGSGFGACGVGLRAGPAGLGRLLGGASYSRGSYPPW